MKIERQIRFNQDDLTAYAAITGSATASEVIIDLISSFSVREPSSLVTPKAKIHRTTVTLTDEQNLTLLRIAEASGLSIDAAVAAMLKIKIAEVGDKNE